MRKKKALAFVLALAAVAPSFAQTLLRRPRTTISVSVFLPFTEENGEVPEASTFLEHGIAAVMAADDFNARNGSLVPEFANRCDAVTLNISDVWNTFESATRAAREFMYDLLQKLRLCTDDPDWYYGTNPGNTCEWVGKKVVNGTLKRCNVKNTDGERNALQACPVTCRSCDQALPEDRAIAGAFKSAVSGPFSNIADVYELPVISHGSTAPALDNEDTYTNFMRTIPSDVDVAKAYCAWCLENNWRSIGVIAVDDLFGRGLGDAIGRECRNVRVTASVEYFVRSSQSLESSMREKLEELTGTKIYFLVVQNGQQMETMGRLAIEMGRTGPDFAWTTQDPDPAIWAVNQSIAEKFFPGFGILSIDGIAPEQTTKFRRAYAAQDPKRFAYFGDTAGEAAVPTSA